MTRLRILGWAASANPKERDNGHRTGTSTMGSDATPLNRNVPCASVGWMTLHPSTNVLHTRSYDQNQRWKTLRGFTPYGRVKGPRCLP